MVLTGRATFSAGITHAAQWKQHAASLEPDVIVEPSWSDYVAGRDPAFEAAAARIRKDARRRR